MRTYGVGANPAGFRAGRRAGRMVSSSNVTPTVGWRLGTRDAPCVQADNCVLYPALRAHAVYVAAPPFFTCAEQHGSAISGHALGVQREVHLLSRLQSLDFAAEAYRQEVAPPTRSNAPMVDAAGVAEMDMGMDMNADADADADADAEVSVEAPVGQMAQLVETCALLAAGEPIVGTPIMGPPIGALVSEPTNSDALENVLVHRRQNVAGVAVRLERSTPPTDGDGASVRASGRALVFKDGASYRRVGVWAAEGTALVMQWAERDEPITDEEEGESEGEARETAGVEDAPTRTQLFCRHERADGSYLYVRAPIAEGADAAPGEVPSGGATADADLETLAPLLPPQAHTPPASHERLGALPFRFWVHDEPALWWRPLLQCTPDYDLGLDAQNSAEVWLIHQLLAHPNRTRSWRDASVVVLPLLPKTSLHAASCLGTDHHQRLVAAVRAILAHPAYTRRRGHDHLVLFNYWDAWGIFGARGTPTHAAFANVTFGWHETQDAKWGMANHRHIGKCQISLPYVESAHCARRGVTALLGASRPVPAFFAGAAADFDTQSACPNVARHATEVRRAFLSLDGAIDGVVVRSVQHNLRACNGSAACEDGYKAQAASEFARARFCLVAGGDTPSTGRLYDAIACLCVPLIAVDDLQLPFAHALAPLESSPPMRALESSPPMKADAGADPPMASSGALEFGITPEFGVHGPPHESGEPPLASAMGVRVREQQLLANPSETITRALAAADGGRWAALQASLLGARRQLSYRMRGSMVASLALREAWASCLHTTGSGARPPQTVAKC